MAFPTTRWSLLAQATLHGDSAAGAALAEVYRRYHEPVMNFIARQPGPQGGRAEDLAQEFFIYLMDNSTLRRADRARGRFRSFLLATLMRFLSRERARSSAEKRGSGAAPVSLEDFDGDAELVVPAAVARAFDREWAHGLLVGARCEVEAAWTARGLVAEFATLQNFLPGSAAPPAYEAAAGQVGWPLARLKTEVFRLRSQFREQLRAAVALTVDAPDEVDAEMAHLHTVLVDAGA